MLQQSPYGIGWLQDVNVIELDLYHFSYMSKLKLYEMKQLWVVSKISSIVQI